MTPDELIAWAWAIGWSLLILLIPGFIFIGMVRIASGAYTPGPKTIVSNSYSQPLNVVSQDNVPEPKPRARD